MFCFESGCYRVETSLGECFHPEAPSRLISPYFNAILSVYSLDEARAFIQRSFGNFLQTEGKQRKQIEAANLEADARRLMTEYKETASADAQEISVSKGVGADRRCPLE